MSFIALLIDCIILTLDQSILSSSFLHLLLDLSNLQPCPLLLHLPDLSKAPLLLELDLDFCGLILLLVLKTDQLLGIELGLFERLTLELEFLLKVFGLYAKFIDISIREFQSFLIIRGGVLLNKGKWYVVSEK